MLRRMLMLIVLGALTLPVFFVAPAEANRRGSVYERDRYSEPYSFTDDSCGFKFKVKGGNWGRRVYYNVRGSDGEAFLQDNRYHFREVLTNPANGKTMYIHGRGRFTEWRAWQVKGDVWKFFQVDRGRPFVIKNADREIVLADHGKVAFMQVFDTLGDGKPGGREISSEVLWTRGHFPGLSPRFDFCRVVRRLIG
jgi:hypothetical protein